MTTYIVTIESAACDSLWTDNNDQPTAVPVNKYLLQLSELDGQDDFSAYLIVMSGDFEQIVLFQAKRLGIINEQQYEVVAEEYRRLGYGALSLVSVEFETLEVDSYQAMQGPGAYYGGSGGQYAFDHYRDFYCTLQAVAHAIERDQLSGPDVCRFIFSNPDLSNMQDIDELMYNEVFRQTESLCVALQSGERGGNMADRRYAGCKTSPHKEAEELNINELKRSPAFHSKASKRLRTRLKYGVDNTFIINDEAHLSSTNDNASNEELKSVSKTKETLAKFTTTRAKSKKFKRNTLSLDLDALKSK